ncbi:HAMP domain-containing protein [Mesobacillus zeae]|uniref:histidine kinase n=2 Tax=Mesobacillus zeae TaxID=1917180 RepID=A0A398B3L4_9BACI|nr:HAMP domain-containing protein [Mesobacillus zeae]
MIGILRSWLLTQPIRNKVLVFGVVMSSIPLILISLYYYSFVKSDLEERIIEKQSLILKNLSREIEVDFDQTWRLINERAGVNQLYDHTESNYYNLLHESGSIEEVVVTNEQGYVEKRVSRYELNLPGKEKWLPESMMLKLQTNDQAYGKVEFNPYGQPVIKLAVPFTENGRQKTLGVVLQLQKIIGKISSLRQDHSSYIYLVDSNERIIAHQDYSRLWRKQPNEKSDDVVGVKSKLDDLGWTLVMEQPESTAYAPIKQMVQNGMSAAVLVILVVSLISVSAGLYFTNPIVKIDQAMNLLKQGRGSTRISINRKDELGKLANSFNEMSNELVLKSRQLEQEKERLEVVVNGNGAGMALVTKDYKITWMNPVLRNWFKNDSLSLPCYALIGGESAPCEDCPIYDPNSKSLQDKRLKFKTNNDEDKTFRHRVFPLNHAIEGEGEFLVVVEDITEQQLVEEKMVQTDKLSALGIMASSFAHEVNNPLATINAYAEDLLDRIDVEDETMSEGETEHYLRVIQQNIERCKRITGNLLNFSRKQEWNAEVFDIQEIIDSSISLVDYQLKKNKIHLTLSIEENLPGIRGDGLKLMQVMVNLINNAVDAMEEEEERKLIISALKSKGGILLKVEDSGNGISPEIIPRLFDPFFTTKSAGKGTGLGLSVCYGIIQQFGGSIEVESKCEEGSVFKLFLPLSEGKGR